MIILKLLLAFYIIGIVCGALGYLIIRLQITSYIHEKQKQGLCERSEWRSLTASELKNIIKILTPIYHYFILIGAMQTSREHLASLIDKQIADFDK